MFPKMLLLLLFPLLASGELEPFRCNSPKEVREMRIKQVYQTDKYTYLLTDHQLIVLNPLVCFLNAKNRTVCAVNEASYEVKNSKFISRTGNVKLKGIVHRVRENFLVYENLDDNKLEGHRLSTDDSMDLKEEADIITVNQTDPLFSGQIFTLYSETAIISYNPNQPNLLNLNFTVNGKEFIGKKQVNFPLSNLMAYELNPLGKEALLVFESSKVHVSFFETKQSSNEFQMPTRPIEFAVLFNCPRKMEKVEDLKGIFYSDGTFYIFFGAAFYLEIKDDLLATKFTISEGHYRKARRLKFLEPNKKPIQEVYFNLDLNKFVKQAKGSGYFVALDSIFKLNLTDGELVGTVEKGLNNLFECEHSSLSHEGALYCFGPKQLFIISSDAKPISYTNLFSGTGVEFDAGDPVQVAFSHSESITIMTKTSYYTFRKKSLELKGSQITLKPSSEKPVIKDTHHLFEKPIETVPDETSNTLLLLLIIMPVLGILLLIAYLKGDTILSFFPKKNIPKKPSATKSASIPKTRMSKS